MSNYRRQEKIWNKIYFEKKLMTGNKPQSSLMHFIKYLKKEWKKQDRSNDFGESAIKGKFFLDLGSGEGKNSIFLARSGGIVKSIDISKVACENFKQRLNENNELLKKEIMASCGSVDIINGSISDDYINKFSFRKNEFDVVIDVTASNALTHAERKEYLKNVYNVLKDDGYFFVRVPAKDENAKKMIEKFSAKNITGSKDSYIIPELELTETVFTEETFKEIYSRNFRILRIQKEKHYLKSNNKVYKRFYIVAYMIKK